MKRLTIVWLLGLLMLLNPGYGVYAQAPDANAGSPPAAPAPDQKPQHHFSFPIGLDRIPEQDRANMQLPFGIGVNYFASNERYRFKSASVSINGQPIPSQMMVLDSLSVSQDSSTVLGDMWLLPFLDVYVVGGSFKGTTKNIKASMADPRMTPPIPQSIAFTGTNLGYGATLAGGYKNVFLTYDWNVSWARLDLASGRIPTVVQGPRLGVRLGRGDVLTDLYVGGFHESVSGDAAGTITFQGFGQFDYKVVVAPESAWNYVVGAHLNLHKHWQIGIEHGFGKRTQDLFTVDSRF